MPLTRYQIRNEYSLADPELYRAADKDDPEALLEGVAMAGLVGVLRQLGDLAEFAAEIFHDLHEEVMVTAARGHGLMIRIQQLEAEFPPIEKAFLSKNSHSSFVYNAGIDWHPNLQMEQNLITRGDLPRFVMDSYEECRGPPRLFLLDKFDIAGAGACLKRYSDPSFFKAEFTSSEATKPGLKREKRARKIKKKALRWRNGETPEVFPTSHSKLHQLFLEEHSQVENNVSVHRVKLKRRHNSSLFDLKTGKSYMEKFLESRSPERKAVCESSISPPLLKMESSNSSELLPEICEMCTRSPDNKLVQRDISPVLSPNRQEKVLDSSIYVLGMEEEILNKLPLSTSDIELENIPSKFYKVEEQKELVVDGESKTEASADGYRSDDVTSDMENYMDALTVMESEMETDTDSRPKNEQGFFNVEKKGVDSDSNEAQLEIQTRLSDTHSVENSIASDDGNNSVKNGRFSLSYSDTLSNLAENVQSDGDVAAEVHPLTEICPADMFEMTSGNISENGDIFRTRSSECVAPNNTCNEVCEIPSYSSEFGEPSCSPCVTDSTFAPSHLSPGASSSEVQLSGSGSIEFSSGFTRAVIERSLSNAEDNGIKLGGYLPCKTDASDIPYQSRDDLLPVGSHESQPMEICGGGNHDVSSDAFMNLPSILDLPHEAKEDSDAVKEIPRAEGAKNSSTQNVINGKLDLLRSVTLPTEEQFHGLAEKDQEALSGTISQPECFPEFPIHSHLEDVRPDGVVVEIENGISTGEKLEYMALVVDQPETSEVAEEKFLETDEVPPIELDSAEVGMDCSEVETVCKNLEVSPHMSDWEVEDGPAPDRDHLKSFSTERNSDLPLDFTSGCTISATPNHASAMVAHSQLADLVTGTIHGQADNEDTIAIAGTVTGLPSGDHIRLQEECLSCNGDSDQDKLFVTEASCPKYVIGSGAQNEVENQPAVAPPYYNFELCNLQSNSPGSEVLDGIHDPLLVECTQNHLPLSDGTEILSSFKVSDQELKLKQPPQCHLSDSAEVTISSSTHSLPDEVAPSEQFLELLPDQLHGGALQEAGESPILSYCQSELAESPNPLDCDAFLIAPSKLSSVDPLSQPSEARLLQPPPSLKFESSGPSSSPLHSTFSSFGLLPQMTHQQPSNSLAQRSILDFSLPDHSVLQASVEEMPPLPPLPPIQWRMGKLRNGSLTTEGETIQPSFNSFSPLLLATADEKDNQQPLNPFLPLPTTDDEKLQHGSESKIIQWRMGKLRHGSLTTERETIQPSFNSFSPLLPATADEKDEQQTLNLFLPLPTTDDEKLQHGSESKIMQPLLSSVGDKIQHDFPTLEGEIAQPLNPFLPLPAVEAEPQHASLTLEGTILQPSFNLFVTPQTIEDVNTQHASMSQSLDTLAPTLNREYENPQQTSPTLEAEVVQPPKSSTPPTKENEKPQHHSLTLEGEVARQVNSSAAIPTVEDGRANRTLKTWLTRPRDPLIEAVASHDKRMLRKVTERVRPQIGVKVDERDSLLEQIRTKSFNLKPAVVTRPSIQGPNTNLKVAAILEKANAIRQALAGSDEDEDGDSWSDS